MKALSLKTRIRISIGIVLVISPIFAGLIYASLEKNKQALDKTTTASLIVIDVSEKRLLSDEYSFTHTDRARQQWQKLESDLEILLATKGKAFSSPGEKDLIAQINKNLGDSKDVFEQMTILYQQGASKTSPEILQEKSGILSSDLSAKTQEAITAAANLRNDSDKSAADNLSRAILLFSVDAVVFLLMLLVSFREIWTSSTRLEKERFESKTILEGIGDGVFAIDRSWNITLWNKTAAELSGWSKREAIGRPFREIVRFINEETKKEKITFIEETMLYGEKRDMENHTLLVTKDGNEIPIGDSCAPIFDKKGAVVGAIIIFRDVSKELEVQKAKDQIIFQTVHDLRAPATAIKSAAAIYSDQEYLAAHPGEYKEGLEMIQEANTRMLDLINSLLDSAKNASGSPHKESVDIAAVLKTTIAEAEPVATQRGVKIVYENSGDLPKVYGQFTRLQEIFTNLIDNATKYNKPNGQITVEFQVEGTTLKSEIKDTGIGISAENLGKLFTPYFRAGADESVVGTGLGLYIVKKFVEEMGGKLEVSSVLGQGTTFTVALPIVN